MVEASSKGDCKDFFFFFEGGGSKWEQLELVDTHELIPYMYLYPKNDPLATCWAGGYDLLEKIFGSCLCNRVQGVGEPRALSLYFENACMPDLP